MKTVSAVLLIFTFFRFGYVSNKCDTGPAPNALFQRETIQQRFAPPSGYKRVAEEPSSFASYLCNLKLKPKGSLVTYFNGSTKPNNSIYAAVIDLPIGKKDLHQCADAVMRLRADYLYSRKQYDAIHFNFINGFRADYAKWRKGQRISVNGNNVKWTASGTASNSYDSYWKYLEMVFAYAGTASLSKEMTPVNITDIKAGDVFIRGGFPGHAVIVVDVAFHATTGKKIMLLAQSYMPAQELQILLNPDSASAWYPVRAGQDLMTPEWVFKVTELKRFGE